MAHDPAPTNARQAKRARYLERRRERRAVPPVAPIPLTHFVDWDQPKYGRRDPQQWAVCNRKVRSTAHSNTPNCPDCQRVLADRDED